MPQKEMKVLIGDSSHEFGLKTAHFLFSKGLYAYTRKNNYHILLDSIMNDVPDIAILNITDMNMDAILIMKQTLQQKNTHTKFILVSAAKNSAVEQLLMENGASCIMNYPFDPEKLFLIIQSLGNYNDTSETKNIEIRITNTLLAIGLTPHLKGFHYIRTAVILTYFNPDYINNVTKLLYPQVAAQHNTTPSRVEKSIRHAIEKAWNSDAFSSTRYLPYDLSRFIISRPTNSELVAIIADQLRISKQSEQQSFSL